MTEPFGAGGGVVASFDDHLGAGTIRDEAGEVWPFHCTAIADGARTIEPGTPVSFRVVAGHHGRWEATELLRPPPDPLA